MMGSRAGIAERRLRPLWDAIDTRQYKTALKLASSLQAKHPDSAYILALKALVLERTGKSDEALVLCQQARESGPVDELTLSTLQTVYNRLQLVSEATACYEYACSKVTNNVELLMALFKCYVRQYVYVKQQQTAMKLYKQIGEERFLLWAVCSILMQVGSENGNGSKLIALAEALLKKRVDTHGLHDLEALMLYISVLQQQEKHHSALEVLSGKLGELFSIQSDKLRLQGELLMSTHQYNEAAEVFQEILKTSSDDWGVFLSYLDASLRGAEPSVVNSSTSHEQESSICLQEDMVEEKLGKVTELALELQEMQVQELRRGPFLAIVEIEKKRLILRQKAIGSKQTHEQSSSPLVMSIVAFFERFGHLLSFASDVSGFVQYIDESNKLQLSMALHEASTRNISDNPVRQLRRKVSAFQVEEQLRVKLTLSDKDLVSHASEIVKLYLESLELSVNLDAQESMHGEELLVLATNLLIEVFRRTQQFGYLLEAILVLEFGLYARRFSSPYKLLLIHLYSTLSAVMPALDWYRTLDVKYILLETLSHFMMPGMLGSTRWSDLQSLLKDSLKFYDSHQTDSADLTILAYQHCTYSKVLEFVEFKERLERSHQRLIFRIEADILALKLKAEKLEEVEFGLVDLDFGKKAIEWSSEEKLRLLSFNEDLQTRPWWSPEPDKCYLIGSLRTVSSERSWHHIETEVASCSELHVLLELAATPEISGCLWHPQRNWEEQGNRENRWRSVVRRRCLVPRILCLLLNTVKETGVTGQSGSDTSSLEFRNLLEEFLKTLSLELGNVEKWLLQATTQGKLIEMHDSGISPVEIMTLTVFWTSYQLMSNDTGSNSSAASVVVNVMEYIVEELLKVLTCSLCIEESDGKEGDIVKVITPGSAVSNLVGLTSESFAWLGLYLQAWARHLQPVPKKKKKAAGSVDQNDNPVCSQLLASLESIRSASIVQLEKLKVYMTDHLRRSEELEVRAMLALLHQDSSCPSSPGSIISVLESGMPVASKLAARSSNSKQTWGAASYVKNMVSSQRATLVGIQDCCTSRLKALRSLKF